MISVEEKKHFVKYFGVPFFVMLLFYWSIMSAVNIHWGQPVLSVETELKYLISLLFSVADKDHISAFTFVIPPEYAGYIFAGGYSNETISVDQYRILLDTLPLAVAYQWFVYYLPITGIVSLIYYARSPQINREKELKKDKYIRGTHKVFAQEFCYASQKIRDAGIVLDTHDGNLLLSKKKEKEHFIVLGSTGTGKSTLLLAMVSEFVRRNVRLVFVDRKGEFWAHFGKPKTDVLFNPFDVRSVKWNIFNEINFELNEAGTIDKIPPDLQTVADLLFGVNDIKRIRNKYWYTSGASVFCSAVCWCAIQSKTTTQELTEFLSSSPSTIIAAFQSLPKSLQVGLSAIGLKPDAEQVGQIMSMVADCAHQLACFVGMDGEWSVRDWINHGDGNLYLSTAGKNDTNYTSIVTLLLDLIGREIKEFPDDGGQDTQLVICIDELAALPALDTLTFLLTQARSKGVAVIIANQTMERLIDVYGDHAARNIMACTKSRFFFALPEATDAKYIAATLGQAEVERTTTSNNESSGALLSTGQNRKGQSINRTITKDDAFLPADIASLQTGQAIVTVPNLLPAVTMLAFKPFELPSINREFEPCKLHEVSAKVLSKIVKPEKTKKVEKKIEDDEDF